MVKTKFRDGLQIACQVLFLVVFATLIMTGRLQIWLAIFLAGFLLTFIFGRFYCGWICPIRTIQRPITWIKKRLGFRKVIAPNILRKPLFRIGFLIAFLAALAIVMVTSRPLPVLPALTILAVLIGIVLPESLWHRWFCPYGTLLSLPARFSKRFLFIETKRCTQCNLCAKACPAEAISLSQQTAGRQTHAIEKRHCLICHECDRVCPSNAIYYGHKHTNQEKGKG